MKEIQLSQGKTALVDDADFEYLNQWRWSAYKSGKTFYAHRKVRINGKNRMISMHRLILGLTNRKLFCDHQNGNGLDNRRENIRIATPSQNQSNKDAMPKSTSKFMGVSFRKDTQKWQAAISYYGNNIHLGTFVNEVDAARRYNQAAIKVHREFARLNQV